RPVPTSWCWPIPTRKAPTCWPCRPASSSPPPRCHSRPRPTRRCCGCSAEQGAGGLTFRQRTSRDDPQGVGYVANQEGAMALKVELKPGERILIGDCVVTNADQRTRLLIDGSAPILREKDILTAERADSPAKRIYLAVQLMYT